MVVMKKSLIFGSIVATAGTLLAAPQIMHAARSYEKCYGVVKAGKGDCIASDGSCRGTSTKDSQKDAWIFVPTGTCEKLVGGSLQSGK